MRELKLDGILQKNGRNKIMKEKFYLATKKYTQEKPSAIHILGMEEVLSNAKKVN